ncbi:acyltransferase family protein [Salinicoccus hispanicus]|uniref:Acyltransferase family protein n=1 Tax=Salinicoccus hispanicus TaxID=157225 RepID=A0A6N8U3E4_9STAP|nr:acyltransferase family protein [Salinicoccus hispanicus]MXQ50935.1 acyltransferase family protein [Salinicoccus hispanicus]
MEIKKQYRPEIEGLRIIAALLVAIYHIWMMRVSGGVDVFFVVSGFLITTSLLSKYARDGYVKFSTFILGLLKRLLPNALMVLIFVTVAGYFILPEVRHFDTMKEIIASLFYYENWQLAVIGTDYLDQTNEKSPVQHFWAMSIQGQFYVIWFLIVSLTILIFNKTKFAFKKIFFTILAVLFATSLAYSIYLTAVNQPWAYFDTRTRVWEFAVGGLLMLFIFKIRLPGIISTMMGWIGLVGLISTGLLLDVEGSFPSYVALWPVMAAVFVMLAGQNPTRFGVEKFLGSRAMVKLGGLSYGLYLWHWPLLSFYYVIFNTKDVSVIHGIAIILLALGLSFLSTNLIENPINRYISKNNFTLKAFRPIFALVVTLVIAVGAWFGISQYQSSATANLAGSSEYPGVMVNVEGFDQTSFEEKDPIPAMSEVKEDKEESYTNGCQQGIDEAEVELCEYGDVENPEYIVAVVGGSKSTHWTSPVKVFAEEDNIKVLNVTKSGCRFSLDPVSAEDCNEWNENVVQKLVEADVDAVITLADIARPDETEVPQGYLDQFNRLEENGIEVLAVRDTPYFNEDIPECITAKGADHEDCSVQTDAVYPTPSAWDKLENPPENVHYVDYHEYFCEEDTCGPIIGNVIGYYDHDHMTKTFAESFAPILREDLMKVLES